MINYVAGKHYLSCKHVSMLTVTVSSERSLTEKPAS